MNEHELDQKKEKAKKKVHYDSLKPISFEEYEKTVHQWMLVIDPGIVKLMPAILIANKLARDPIWIFIIAPSGGGKSEMLAMMNECPEVYPLSLITPNTFLSGMPGPRDTSLLPQISGKVLSFSDWTNLMAMQKDTKNEIMGQLRDIYSGYLRKIFGTGKIAEWSGKIGIVAATTPVVDLSQQQQASLGERFIHYRMLMPERKLAAQRALENSGKQKDMRAAMADAFGAFMKGIEIPESTDALSLESQQEVIRLANFATMARSGVIREFGMKKDVIFVPGAEMPTRLTQQLLAIAAALSVMNGGKVLEDDMRIVYKIALDSIPRTNYIAIEQMARSDERTTAEIATSIGYPTATIRQYLENLALLGVCARVRGQDSEQGGSSDRWTLVAEFTEILRKFETIKEIEKEVEIVDAFDTDIPPLDSEPTNKLI